MMHVSSVSKLPAGVRSLGRLLVLGVVGGAMCAGSLHVLSGNAATMAFAQGAPAVARKPSVVAVVNMKDLLDGVQEFKDLNAALDPTRTGYKAQLDELETRIKALEVEIKDNLSPEQAMLKAEKQLQLAELRNVRDYREKSFVELMDIRNGEILRKMYLKVSTAISAYAKREGIDLVLLDDRGIPVPERANQSQINNIILSKRVLHADDAINITPALVTFVNNEYGAGAKP